MADTDEQGSFDDFGPADCLGAMLFLSVVPPVIFYVFGEPSMVTLAFILGVGVSLAIAVWALAFVTGAPSVGRWVNWCGRALAVVYCLLAFALWCESDRVPVPEKNTSPADEDDVWLMP